MSEDTKKRALLSEDELDNVAGGSFRQTQEIFATLSRLDPDAANAIAERANQSDPNDVGAIIASGSESILRKHFGEQSHVLSNSSWDNVYIINGTRMDHQQAINFINDRIDIKKAGWIDD